MTEPWRHVFREGLAPLLSTAVLVALRDALAADSPELVQGVTTEPPNFDAEWACTGACVVGFPLWKGRGLTTIGEVEDAFGEACEGIDAALSPDYAAVRWLTTWWDEAPRAEAVAALLPEVERELAARGQTKEVTT